MTCRPHVAPTYFLSHLTADTAITYGTQLRYAAIVTRFFTCFSFLFLAGVFLTGFLLFLFLFFLVFMFFVSFFIYFFLFSFFLNVFFSNFSAHFWDYSSRFSTIVPCLLFIHAIFWTFCNFFIFLLFDFVLLEPFFCLFFRWLVFFLLKNALIWIETHQ